MFSRRIPSKLRPNPLARARTARGRIPFDLTESNPTRCGLPYPESLLGALADPAGLAYEPAPLGLPVAREAVAGEYRQRGVDVDASRIVLTASTSEAYSFLFRLLCEPGDAVAVPVPSYPLFEHLARLDGLQTRTYGLEPELGWQPGSLPEDVRDARAWIAVHPNNPTGSLLDEEAVGRLRSSCAGAVPIVDEVFLDYPLEEGREGHTFVGRAGGPVFVLGGLSKSIGLPQLKLSWIVVDGPDDWVEAALDGLEFVADQYLSVAAPVQHSLPVLLREGASVRAAILERCRTNLAAARKEVAAHGAVSLLEPAGGWSLVLRYPRVLDEEPLVVELLEKRGVAVYPGFFFDFPGDGYLVLSLLPPPDVFTEGLRLLLPALV